MGEKKPFEKPPSVEDLTGKKTDISPREIIHGYTEFGAL